ncbi:hypothetical protein FRB96_002095 [Tulasnella sp. 330]|nr:hypothetical protein FRB96_002095 [Tulasnella sp. 330]
MSKGIHDLTEAEQQVIVKNASLGIGITIAEGSVPTDTGVSVIVPPSMDKINFQDTQVARIDTLVSSSSRSNEWAKEGYGKLKVTGETPAISGSLELSIDVSSENHAAGTELYFMGSHLMPKCKISLPVKNIPHPDFAEAVQEALAETDEKERTAALTQVLDQYGYFYLTSVEMGGMKYISSTKKTDDTTSVSTLKAAMNIAAEKQFAIAKVSGELSAGRSQKESAALSREFESGSQTTVGGEESIDDPSEWKKSLDPPNTWAAINKLVIASVYTLFDTATKAKMKAALPKLEIKPKVAPPIAPIPQAPVVEKVKVKLQPLYRLFNSPGVDHFYTSDPAEKDHVKNAGGWSYEGVACQTLIEHLPDSVQLFRLWGRGEHFYTSDENEANSVKSLGFNIEGVVGYVYKSQKEGTVPLYRSYNGQSNDHFYTVDAGEKDRALGLWGFERIECYVYPSDYTP